MHLECGGRPGDTVLLTCPREALGLPQYISLLFTPPHWRKEIVAAI